MSRWTEGDARAEIARIVERAKTVVPPLETACKSIRQIGTEHGHEKIAEGGIEHLRDAVADAGLALPRSSTVEQELRRALDVSRGRVVELETQLVRAHVLKSPPAPFKPTTPPGTPDGSPAWWDRLSEFARTSNAGHVVAFDLQVSRTADTIVLAARPYLQCEPLFLVLDPRLPEGEVAHLEVAHCMKLAPGSTRISAFQTRGVAPEVFFANRLQTHRVTPAHQVSLILRFDEPYAGPVHAFMWARCFGYDGAPYGT